MDPSIDGQIKYLNYKKKGVEEDPEMDPRYKFEGASLVLEPIPTPFNIPTPSSTPTSSEISLTTTTPTPTYNS
jgi:hypothetical protein